MASHRYSHASLNDFQISAQGSQVLPKIDAPIEPELELSRGCDVILQHAQELKDNIFMERQRNEDRIQELDKNSRNAGPRTVSSNLPLRSVMRKSPRTSKASTHLFWVGIGCPISPTTL